MSVFEDLSKGKNSDKYQYIFPNFIISKLLKTEKNINGNLNYKISGSSRKKDTNVGEKYLINDLQYTSNSFFSFGSVSNFEIFLKTVLKTEKIHQIIMITQKLIIILYSPLIHHSP